MFLYKDVFYIIFEFLDIKDIVHFAKTNKCYYNITKRYLYRIYHFYENCSIKNNYDYLVCILKHDFNCIQYTYDHLIKNFIEFTFEKNKKILESIKTPKIQTLLELCYNKHLSVFGIIYRNIKEYINPQLNWIIFMFENKKYDYLEYIFICLFSNVKQILTESGLFKHYIYKYTDYNFQNKFESLMDRHLFYREKLSSNITICQ